MLFELFFYLIGFILFFRKTNIFKFKSFSTLFISFFLSFHRLLIPNVSNASSVGVLSNNFSKTQLPKPAIAPIGPPYINPPALD